MASTPNKKAAALQQAQQKLEAAQQLNQRALQIYAGTRVAMMPFEWADIVRDLDNPLIKQLVHVVPSLLDVQPDSAYSDEERPAAIKEFKAELVSMREAGYHELLRQAMPEHVQFLAGCEEFFKNSTQ